MEWPWNVERLPEQTAGLSTLSYSGAKSQCDIIGTECLWLLKMADMERMLPLCGNACAVQAKTKSNEWCRLARGSCAESTRDSCKFAWCHPAVVDWLWCWDLCTGIQPFMRCLSAIPLRIYTFSFSFAIFCIYFRISCEYTVTSLHTHTHTKQRKIRF